MSGLVEIQKKLAAAEQAMTPRVVAPSAGAGAESQAIFARLRDLRRQMNTPAFYPTTRHPGEGAGGNLEEALFDKRASLKMMTAAVAMHLDPERRTLLFRQLDSLLALETWEQGDRLADDHSFYTFLRMIIYIGARRSPGIGLAHNGNLIAAWTANRNRLTIECLPKDQVRWVLTRFLDEDCERAAGITPLSRLPEVLAPYDPQIWFDDGGTKEGPVP